MKLSDQSSEALKEFCAKHEDIIDRVKERDMEAEFSPIKGMYVDLVTMKDLRMGLMLYLARNNPEMTQYLISHLDTYLRRPNRSFMSYAYPEYTLASEAQMKVLYHDPEYAEHMFNYAPDTEITASLAGLVNKVSIQNERSEYKQPFILTINIYPCMASPMLMRFKAILEGFLGDRVSVQYVRYTPDKVPEQTWYDHRIIVLDDIADYMVKETSFSKAMTSNDAPLLGTIVQSHPTADPQIYQGWLDEGMDPYDIKAFLLKMAHSYLYFNLGCKFEYVFFRIPPPNTP